MTTIRRSLLTSVFSVLLLAIASIAPAATLTWTTAVDTTSTTTNSLRSVALAQDAGNDSIYIGYIQTSPNGRDVRRFDTDAPYAFLNSRSPVAGGDQPKSIATDDRGNVFVGNRLSGSQNAIIRTHNTSLVEQGNFNASGNEFGGLATYKSGSDYYLYIAREAAGQINRYNINNSLAATLDLSFGAGGTYTLPGVNSTTGVLRGLTVADDGTIFVASRADSADGGTTAGALHRISADLSTVTSAVVPRAMDVALFGGNAYATSYNGAASLIRTLDASTLAFVEDITITTLDNNTYVRGTAEGWSGIDIGDDGRIWLVDQLYQVSGTASDRLLVGSSLVPEPGTLAIMAMGAMGIVGFARRRR
jgi:hypothetical protein